MRQTKRGSEVTDMGSDRALFYSDALVDGYQSTFVAGGQTMGLLASNASKKIFVMDNTNLQAIPAAETALYIGLISVTINAVLYNLVPAIAKFITIVNESGEDATVGIGVCHNDQPWLSNSLLWPIYPYRIPAGEAASGIFARGVQFIETNTGAGTQTGAGLRYYVELERKQY